jgi:tight adherence protein E
LVNSQGFQRSIRYVETFDDLEQIEDSCVPEEGESSVECNKPDENEQMAIAIYRVSYNYKPIFSSFFGSQESVFAREMIVVQEYQRDKFNFGGS